jgi:hypothetical protein
MAVAVVLAVAKVVPEAPAATAVEPERVVSVPAAAGHSASAVATARPAVVAAADSPQAAQASARRRDDATTAVPRRVVAGRSQCAHANRSKHSSTSLDRPTR